MGLFKNPFSRRGANGNRHGDFEPTETELAVIQSCSDTTTSYGDVQQAIEGLGLPHDRQVLLENEIRDRRMSNVLKSGPERGT